MIIALRLSNGDEIIGDLKIQEGTDFNQLKQVELDNPMWIIHDESGSVMLRDALLLYSNNSLSFFPQDITITYRPNKSLASYYQTAIQYSKEFTRDAITSQIDESNNEFERWLRAVREHKHFKKTKLH